MSIVNIAAYRFSPQDPVQLEPRRDSLRSLCRQLDLRGTILLSSEGINLFLAGTRIAIDDLLAHLRGLPGLEDLQVKESLTDYQPFHRMLVKIKREIIPVGCSNIPPDPEASPKISPAALKAWLDEGREIALLDTRNDYEVSLGTFHGAIDLSLKNFREFPAAAATLPEEIKKKPVVMFCTGGIRCEKIGPYMKGLGFDEIYQLDGGILKYFEECQQAHYDGECFVFDQRVAIDPALAPTGTRECYACKHSLTPEDFQSPEYQEGRSCPHCYVPPEIQRDRTRAERQQAIDRIAHQQRGCIPHESRRWISVPQRCAGQSLIEALPAIYPGWSKERWLQAIVDREITAPAATKIEWRTEPVSADRCVREGERFLHVQPHTVEPAVDPRIVLLHEDEALVIVSKGAPLPLHPSGRYERNTLESILNAAYAPEKLRPAHRIDAMTTGLVVLARRFAFASRLQPQFAQGQVEKTYLAWVSGDPAWDEQLCELAIGNTPLSHGGRALDPYGLPASTTFRIRARHGDRALVEAIPHTGRTHQLRLHLAALGHPILGDPLYAARTTDSQAPEAAMMLHAWRLAFHHPVDGRPIEFEAPLPASWLGPNSQET